LAALEDSEDTDSNLVTKRVHRMQTDLPTHISNPRYTSNDKKRKLSTASRPPLARQTSADSMVSTGSDSGMPKQRRVPSKTGHGRPCLNAQCPWDAAEDSWYCSDTCAVVHSSLALARLVEYRKRLCRAWAVLPQQANVRNEYDALLVDRVGVHRGDFRAFGPALLAPDTLHRITRNVGLELETVTAGLRAASASGSSGTDAPGALEAEKDEVRDFLNRWLSNEKLSNELPSDKSQNSTSKDGGISGDLALFMPRCSRDVLSTLLGHDKHIKHSLCNPSGPSEFVSIICAPGSPGSRVLDKSYGPRLTVRQQFEAVFVYVLKELGARGK
jgi:hypothetical protein